MAEASILKPISAEWPEARLAAKIDLWRRMGISWQAIADELGLPGKYEAKRKRKELEHRVRLRQLAG